MRKFDTGPIVRVGVRVWGKRTIRSEGHTSRSSLRSCRQLSGKCQVTARTKDTGVSFTMTTTSAERTPFLASFPEYAVT